MKRVFLLGTVAVGALTAALLYERLAIELWFGPSSVAALLFLLCVFGALLASFRLYDGRHRNAVLSAWLVVVFTGGTFFVADFIAGLFLIKPLSPALVPDPNRHHVLVPNTYSRIEQSEFSYVQRVNNLGMRGVDATIAKPADTFRILALGDSYTMGKGMPDDETFSVVLEKRLNARTAACGGPHIQVLNGGVDSYAPVLSLIQLRELGQLNADIVFENLDVSDLSQEAVYRRIGVVEPDGNPVRVPGVKLTRPALTDVARNWVDQHLVFTRWILVSINKMFHYGNLGTDVLSQADPEIVNYTLVGDTVDRRPEWDAIFDSLLRMKKLSNSEGSAFVLVVYPWPHQYSDTSWIPGRYAYMSKDARPSDASVKTITARAAQDSIELLNVYPAFLAYHGSRDLYYKHDMHWTSTGASVMAGALGDYLESKYMDAWCRKQ